MTGSRDEAEDLVQEALLAAWRNRASLIDTLSVRSWLYRIATNTCLNALTGRRRARRLLPQLARPAGTRDGPITTEARWLEPYPDAEFEGIADPAPGPAARYELRETVKLAFIAVIQLLPPRQRAAIILSDVIGWSAVETAELLETSVPSVNSALQRGRATLAKHFPRGRTDAGPANDGASEGLLERYLAAWEGADLGGFVALLREDALFSMPPLSEWYAGRAAIHAFFGGVWHSYAGFRLLPIAANGEPAFAAYARSTPDGELLAHSIQVLTLEGASIAALTMFKDPRLFPKFGLADHLPAER